MLLRSFIILFSFFITNYSLATEDQDDAEMKLAKEISRKTFLKENEKRENKEQEIKEREMIDAATRASLETFKSKEQEQKKIREMQTNDYDYEEAVKRSLKENYKNKSKQSKKKKKNKKHRQNYKSMPREEQKISLMELEDEGEKKKGSSSAISLKVLPSTFTSPTVTTGCLSSSSFSSSPASSASSSSSDLSFEKEAEVSDSLAKRKVINIQGEDISEQDLQEYLSLNVGLKSSYNNSSTRGKVLERIDLNNLRKMMLLKKFDEFKLTQIPISTTKNRCWMRAAWYNILKADNKGVITKLKELSESATNETEVKNAINVLIAALTHGGIKLAIENENATSSSSGPVPSAEEVKAGRILKDQPTEEAILTISSFIIQKSNDEKFKRESSRIIKREEMGTDDMVWCLTKFFDTQAHIVNPTQYSSRESSFTLVSDHDNFTQIKSADNLLMEDKKESKGKKKISITFHRNGHFEIYE